MQVKKLRAPINERGSHLPCPSANTRCLRRLFLGVHKKLNKLSDLNFVGGNGLFSGLAITNLKFFFCTNGQLTVN
jgi:hypothetical protein